MFLLGTRGCARRTVLALAVAGLTLAALPAAALDRLTIVAPANPGGGWDQTARAMQEALQTAGIVPAVQVENIAGAGGTIGLAQFVTRHKGRGNALLVGGLVMVGAILTNQSPVGLDQVTTIARLTGEYEAIVVPKSSPIQSMTDLVAKLKQDPGAVSWGGGSAGGTDHMLVGLIAKAAGVDPTRINYIPFSGGGEALASIMGGHVTAGVSGLGEFVGQIQAGDLRALAVSAPERLPGIDIPTLKEQGIDVELVNWRGLLAGPRLREADREALLATVDRLVKSDAWRNILQQKDWMDLYLSGDQFAAYLQDEQQKVAAVLKDVGLVK